MIYCLSGATTPLAFRHTSTHFAILLSIGSFAISGAPRLHVSQVALLILLSPLTRFLCCLRFLFGTQRIGRPPFTHPCSRLSAPVGPDRIIAFYHADSLYFRIAFMLAAIPFLPIALVKAERSPRLAAFVHAVMLKQPDWSFLHWRPSRVFQTSFFLSFFSSVSTDNKIF